MPSKAGGILLSILILASGALAAKPKVETPQTVGFKVLYNFNNGMDGGAIFAGLTRDRNGNLYGTTQPDDQDHGYGTLFKLIPEKRGFSFHILAHFTYYIGENCMTAPVVDDAGNIYGVCSLGGSTGGGTLWEYTRSGKLKVLFNFYGSVDGYWPNGIVLIGSDLYGTTAEWGLGGAGTFWKYSLKCHIYTLLHSFADGSDGGSPGGPTMDHKGKFWGVTAYGPNCYDCGDGTVWTYDPSSRTFTTVLDFSSTGISLPSGDFAIDAQGNLFSTAFPNSTTIFGMVFELVAANNYVPVILYTFTDKSEGWGPGQIRLDKYGNLIGTTYLGGQFGAGTVYELAYKDGNWQETIIHSFNGNDGSSPLSGVVTDNMCRWFGTTVYGGKHGWGEVFEISGLPYQRKAGLSSLSKSQ